MSIDLSHLNPEQHASVTHLDGPLLVLAGAGSGKTRVITSRTAWLVDQGIAPNHILAVSFTNKAANEMSERVAGLLGVRDAGRVHLSTFHALGAQILREDIDKLEFQKPFSIIDQGERRRLFRSVLKELRLDGTGSSVSRLLGLISRSKNAMCEPMELPAARYNPEVPRAQRVYDLYNTALRNLNAVDFDDLLLLPTHMLRMFPELRAKYRNRYRYIMVDEYQDTNPLQLQMLEELVEPSSPNLVAVGDDDQSIYGFRGAAADTILKFDHTFPDARVIALEQNYRSVGTILQAANALITNNSTRRDKKLWSALGDGTKIRSVSLETPNAEAAFVAGQVDRLVARGGMPWSSFAVLYRSNTQSGALEEAFRKLDIPYQVIGGQSLFDNKEVKDVLAYLQLLLNPRDELSLRRVINFPTRGIGTKTVQTLSEHAQEADESLFDTAKKALEEGALHTRAERGMREFIGHIQSNRAALYEATSDELSDIVHQFIEDIRLEAGVYAAENNERAARARWRVVERLLRGLQNLDSSSAFEALDRWMTGISLDTHISDDDSEDTHSVKLLTIHASKGLEFPVVFLIGMSEEFLPHRRALEEAGGVEEERRLCYVGMTRAQRILFMTRPRAILMRDERKTLKASRFLGEIPEELVEERHFRRQRSRKSIRQNAAETQEAMNDIRLKLFGYMPSISRRQFLLSMLATAGASLGLGRRARAFGERAEFQPGLLRYPGNSWNARPGALQRLLVELELTTSVLIAQEAPVVTADASSLVDTPLIFIGGDREFPAWSSTDREALRRYVSAGGIMIFDSSEGQRDGGFRQSVERELSHILPDGRLSAIAEDHVVHKSFYLCDGDEGRIRIADHLDGIEDNGHLAAIYCHNDLMGAWARDDFGNYEFQMHPGGQRQRQMSYRMGINLIMYALCLDYKADQVHVPFILRRRHWKVE